MMTRRMALALALLLFVVLWDAARGQQAASLCGVPAQDVPEWMELECTEATDTSAGYWRLVSFRVLDPDAGNGQHHLFAKLYRDGEPLADAPFTVAWPDGVTVALTKAPPEWGDIPLWECYFPEFEVGPYRGYAGTQEQQSDTVSGMGLPNCFHYSFEAEWEWQEQTCEACSQRLWLPLVSQ